MHDRLKKKKNEVHNKRPLSIRQCWNMVKSNNGREKTKNKNSGRKNKYIYVWFGLFVYYGKEKKNTNIYFLLFK